MEPKQLHDDKFLRILWDEKTRIIAIDWKDATSAITTEEFKAELTAFAGHVEERKAPTILVDVSKFHHQMASEVPQWRVKNISSRYNTAGVKRFAFLFAKDSQLPVMPELSEGESFPTRAFNVYEQAVAWLTSG